MKNRRGKREGGGARGVLTRRLAAAAPWTHVAKKHCSDSKHATAYASFGQAQAACAGNAACLGVYDSACDGRAPYYMCKAGFALSTSSSSCVYAEREFLLRTQNMPLARGERRGGWQAIGGCLKIGRALLRAATEVPTAMPTEAPSASPTLAPTRSSSATWM